MAFTPEQLALVSQYSPSYQAALTHESNAAYDEELAKQQAAEQAESMKGNREQYLGNPNVRLGLPSVDPRYQTKQPTGYYAEGVDPMRRFQAERNFAQGTSGVPALADRGLDNESAMQDSLNSNINTIAQERWKKENIPQKRTNPYANVYTGDDNRRYGTNLETGQTEEIPGGADARSSKLVDVNVEGDGDPNDEMMKVSDLLKFKNKEGDTPKQLMSANQLNEQGYVLDEKLSEGDKKAVYVSDSLKTASDMVELVLDKKDFNPTGLVNAGGKVSDWLASSDYKQYKAASDEWATNLVFLRSGATAREEEKKAAFENFWAQPSDDAESARFKDRFRRMQEINAYSAAAQAGRIDGAEAKKYIENAREELAKMDAEDAVKANKTTMSAPVNPGLDASLADKEAYLAELLKYNEMIRSQR